MNEGGVGGEGGGGDCLLQTTLYAAWLKGSKGGQRMQEIEMEVKGKKGKENITEGEENNGKKKNLKEIGGEKNERNRLEFKQTG